MANGKKKGDRRERQAQEILEEAGWIVETPNSTPYPQGYGVDFFGIFDFMAFKDGDILFGQVKSNGARGITTFHEECIEKSVPIDAENVEVEFWTCYDKEGWRIDKISRDGYETVFDERDKSGNMGEHAIEFKKQS